MDLKGITVVITRPTHQADSLNALLQNYGAKVQRLPLMTIDSHHSDINQQAIKNCVLDLDHYHHIVVISANAARLAHDWIDEYWPQLPQRINWLAVGEATAKTLQQLNYPVSSPDTGMNSESLLSLPELQMLDHQRVLIFRGLGGRETLAEQLRARGAKVDYAELYGRTPCCYTQESLQQHLITPLPAAVLISSGEGLQNLTDQVKQLDNHDIQLLKKTTLVVPSARVAELAKKLGYESLCIADNATDQAMVSALASCATH